MEPARPPDAAVKEELDGELLEAVKRHYERAKSNLQRVERLIEIHHATGEDDVLRSAVVFLHATLEDFLRFVAERVYPYASEEALNSIPLVGSKGRHAEKFYLGRLKAHNDKRVSDVIRESVIEHLQLSSFSTVGDVKTVMKIADEYLSEMPTNAADLAPSMERRHKIVHEADRIDAAGNLRPITEAEVNEWLKVIRLFLLEICYGLGYRDYLVEKILEAERSEAAAK